MKKILFAFATLLSLSALAASPDQMIMEQARTQYEKGQLKQALQTYQKISPLSDLWIEAVEEKAWTYLRLNQHGEALAQLKTVLAPTFSTLVGPEPYFLQALVDLRICDYPAVFKTMQTFKERHQERVKAIESLSTTGTSTAAVKAVDLMAMQKDFDPGILKTDVQFLPRMFWRDVQFQKSVLASNKPAALARLKTLAQTETTEYKRILGKMHVVEAEVIQRMYMNEPLSDQVQSQKVETTNSTLKFPVDNEVWLDELDNYHVQAKGCPNKLLAKQQQGRSL